MSQKPKKTKKVNPTDAGFDAEQLLADSLCNQFLKKGVDENDIDEAFVTAFKSLSHRMLTIFNKDFVYELVDAMSDIVDEDNGVLHVCNDCLEKHGPAPKISDEDKNKMH